MGNTTVYHNPRCQKSRQTLELLEENDISFNVVEYLEETPAISKLDALCKLLRKEPLEIMRTKEKRFSELGLSKADKRSRREWLKIMHENPILIERPIVVHKKKAALGRPPEDVLKIFG